MFTCLRIAVLCFLYLSLPFSLSAQTLYYVNDNSSTGDVFCSAVGNNGNNGTSPATPKATLTNVWTTYGPSGTNVLTAGDTIKIDAGTYNTDIFLNITVDGLTFQGAGATLTTFDNLLAGASTNYFMYIIANNITVMDMTITGYENNGTQTPGHSGQAVTIGGGVPIATILFQNVNLSGNGASGGNPALSVLANANVILRGGGSFCNSPGTQYTGGVEAYGDFINLLIEDYLLAYNEKSAFDGGGLRIEGGSNTYVGVRNSRIENNLATNGGGISHINGNLIVQDCIIENNSAGQISSTIYGGAYRATAGTAVFSRCLFLNNNAYTGSLRGGAIACRYSSSPGTGAFSSNRVITLTVDSCVFSGNTPGTNGMDIYAANGSGNSCTVLARDCQFLSAGNYNIVSDGSSPATGISVTYHGAAPTTNGINITSVPSINPIYTPNPSPPNYTGVCGSLVLPENGLLAFEIDCNAGEPEMHWTSGEETSLIAWRIDRYDPTFGFEEVGRVSALQNGKSEYRWRDNNPHPEAMLYRLSKIMADGSSQNVISALRPGNCGISSAMSLYYDGSSLLVRLSGSEEGMTQARLYDVQGRICGEYELLWDTGKRENRLELPASLSSGMYILRLSGSDLNHSARIILP